MKFFLWDRVGFQGSGTKLSVQVETTLKNTGTCLHRQLTVFVNLQVKAVEFVSQYAKPDSFLYDTFLYFFPLGSKVSCC